MKELINGKYYIVHPYWYQDGENAIMIYRDGRWAEVGTDQSNGFNQCTPIALIDEDNLKIINVPQNTASSASITDPAPV